MTLKEGLLQEFPYSLTTPEEEHSFLLLDIKPYERAPKVFSKSLANILCLWGNQKLVSESFFGNLNG